MKRYALVIDHESCWGCKTCEVACKQEFHTPDGVKLISVSEDGPKRVGDKLSFAFHVDVCQHCDDPPCADACPEEAIYKREDGIVVIDYEQCTGCQSCIEACPYGVVGFDDEKNIAQKCNLCYERVDKGLIPACADNVCLAHCIYFGDAEEIRQRMNKKETKTSGDSEGTSHDLPPCLIYIDKDGQWFHKGVKMIHRGFIRLFYQHMEMDSQGRYIINWGGNPCYVEVEDTPFVVRRTLFENREEENDSHFILSLSDDTQERLCPDTLFVGKSNVLYCKVKNCAFPARFDRAAYYQLTAYVQQEDNEYFLPLNGKKYFIRVGSIITE